jgi:exopolysaccharide biosynthesis protein
VIPALPATLAPPAPFPLVVAQSLETEFVAPGVRRGSYHLQTSDGPLVVTFVAVDTREPTLRLGSVVANDTLISSGETVSSMARRTDAVAGVNADYFDIGQTNQPLNLVVRDGALLRTPSRRVVFDVRTDGSVHFENVAFAGSVGYGATTVPLTGVNEWPPQGGASLLTPAFGAYADAPGVDVAELVPAGGEIGKSPSPLAGSYRVASLDAAVSGATLRSMLLGFGPAARARGPLPAVGDTVTIDAATVPPLTDIAAAVGGGPLLVANGAPADDPNAPAPEERDRRFPVSGAGALPNGGVVFVAVDGRRRALSIGLTRPQFAALMLGFGATDAMAFDSGGSATLVARVLGDPAASVLNVPSDGEERAVADGIFVYSNAPQGPPAQLVVRPAAIVALPNVAVPVTLALVDAAGHAVPPDREPAPQVIPGAASSRIAQVRAAGLVAQVPFDVVPGLARLDIAPRTRDPDPQAAVRFDAVGVDARGRTVALGDGVRWTSDGGRFESRGLLRVADRDVRVAAFAGGTSAAWLLRVGRHREPLALFDAAHALGWRFDSAPAGAAGGVAFASGRAELSLRYDFSNGERAAYADTGVALPGEPQSFSVEINGDASGVGVRAAFVNTFGERRALTLTTAVDWSGWRSVTVALPDDLNPPVRLVSLYAVDSLANAATHAAGSLAFRHASVVVAGSP